MFGFLKKGLDKTLTAIRSSKPADKKISKEILEEILLEADIAYEIVEEVLYYLPPQNEVKKDDLKRLLNTYFIYENEREAKSGRPFVELILGVNGAGKTIRLEQEPSSSYVSGRSERTCLSSLRSRVTIRLRSPLTRSARLWLKISTTSSSTPPVACKIKRI